MRTPRPLGGCHQCCTSPSTILPGGRPQNVRSRLARLGIEQGHHVLELIAETVGAAGLIERRSSPDAARENLVRQPAVDERIESEVGRCYANDGQAAIPRFDNFGERRQRRFRLTVVDGELPCPRRVGRLAEHEDDVRFAAGRDLERPQERGTRIVARRRSRRSARRDAVRRALPPSRCGPGTPIDRR